MHMLLLLPVQADLYAKTTGYSVAVLAAGAARTTVQETPRPAPEVRGDFSNVDA